jgi:hypothetical protein
MKSPSPWLPKRGGSRASVYQARGSPSILLGVTLNPGKIAAARIVDFMRAQICAFKQQIYSLYSAESSEFLTIFRQCSTNPRD